MEFVKVIKPGLFTTIQDLGRAAYRIYGVSVSGAMDTLSFRLANLLVGNDEGEAALEVTLIGPTLEFETDGIIAITGGDLSPMLNQSPVPMWKAVRVRAGDRLGFGQCKSGCRSYIAFSGGIDVPKVMDSRSTFVRGGYGGIDGRQLKAGDRLPLGQPRMANKRIAGRKLPSEQLPNFEQDRPIRFIMGPHDGAFTTESIQRFLSSKYTVSNAADRMGYRLEGPTLEHIAGADIISDFISIGTIQVPGNGLPIIHMADCGVSGGYTKLGVIIGVDIPYIAQKKPGDTLQFQQIDIPTAQQEWIEQEQFISTIKLNNALLTGKLSK